MIEPASLIVVGSLNLDLVAQVARLPRRGETLLADGRSRAWSWCSSRSRSTP